MWTVYNVSNDRTIKVMSYDYEWLEDMSDRTDMEIPEIIDAVIDFWRTQKGEAAIEFFK